jgi:hypothetical protein
MEDAASRLVQIAEQLWIDWLVSMGMECEGVQTHVLWHRSAGLEQGTAIGFRAGCDSKFAS